MKLLRLSSKELQRLYNRQHERRKRVEEKVRKILEEVRLYGDEAVVKYTSKFDKIKLSPKNLRVTGSEISGAYQNISPNFVNDLKQVIENVNKFYKRQLKKSWRIKDQDGVVLGEKVEPLERVGIYVPGGTAPLVSTVYMTVLPAKIAGVKEIILVSPPNRYASIDPHILVVANLLKVEVIFKVGGAQAIAALAFGTKTIPKVDKIVGPGNVYVTEAKRQVYGFVDIDMLAGPTELVVIANRFANPSYVTADIQAQSEHLKGTAILITQSKALAKTVKGQVGPGYVILVKNLDQAAEVANSIAPEHLQLMVKNPKKLLKKIKNAGSIFIGPYSPTVVGDYIAGPSHVLPTGGTARFFSGLGVEDFMRSSHVISYSKKALEKVKDPIERIATIEGMAKHIDSLKARF